MKSTPVPPRSPAFVTTRWSLVLRAKGDSPEAKTALGELCVCYWEPVYQFVRHTGRDEATARDLTQSFFARLLSGNGIERVSPERGRFRSFLLGAVRHFLSDSRDHESAVKRGGKQTLVSLDADEADEPELAVAPPPADSVFDRTWAITLVNRAVEALALEQRESGRGAAFETLKPWLLGEIEGRRQSDAAQELGWTENAFRVAVHRLRRRFRDLVKAEVSQTLDDPRLLSEEMGYLLEVLCQ